ncbi:MAG TPA: SDR family oxidoreductase, partial [Ilumatobacteraceae bacterium]
MTVRGHTVVAGGLGGIGTAIVADLAEHGHRVTAVDRRSRDADGWIDEMVSRFGDAVEFRELDVADEHAVQRFAAELDDRGLEVAYLVNAQATLVKGAVWELPLRHFEMVYRVNVVGSFLMCKAFAK